MTSNETKIFNNILEEANIKFVECNGFYELEKGNPYESDCVQTNGYNLLESIRRLVKTKTVERRLV